MLDTHAHVCGLLKAPLPEVRTLYAISCVHKYVAYICTMIKAQLLGTEQGKLVHVSMQQKQYKYMQVEVNCACDL